MGFYFQGKVMLVNKLIKVSFNESVAVKFGDLSDDKTVDKFVKIVIL